MNRTLAFSLRALAVAALMTAWQIPVGAQEMDNGSDSKYEAAKARCEQMASGQKESCLRQAEKSKNNGSSDKAEHKQMKEEYKAEKKKCEAMSGADKDTCMQDLKAKYHH